LMPRDLAASVLPALRALHLYAGIPNATPKWRWGSTLPRCHSRYWSLRTIAIWCKDYVLVYTADTFWLRYLVSMT
jgi:hypothetical protein